MMIRFSRVALIALALAFGAPHSFAEISPQQTSTLPTDLTVASSATEPTPITSLTPLISGQAAAAFGVQAVDVPADLWDRIRRGYGMQDLSSPLVTDREIWYSSRPEYLIRISERGRKYMFHIVEELERRNMPTELALLPYIESAFVTHAVSSAKAAGMWQFMPATGKDFNLKQNLFRDDRRDVLASTRAALDYLSRLHRMFGDWNLALAAYNWGEGSVGRAVAKNKRAGLPTSYTDLSMPDETRLYVPKLQAVKNIVSDPSRFKISLPVIENHPFFQTVDISRDMDVEVAARLAEVKLDEFISLNPSANKPVILAAGTQQILLPWDNAAIFASNLAKYTGKLASWTAWTVPSTMRPADAAQRVGMSEARLREINRIPPRHSIRAGSTLLVPRGLSSSDVGSKVADLAQLSLAAEARKVCRKVKGKTTCKMVAASAKTSGKKAAASSKKSGKPKAVTKRKTVKKSR